MEKKKLHAIIILDGYGESDETEYNAIKRDGSKYITQYRKNYPSTLISASGMDVGLPEGQMGNSEVGHLNIGAGRIVYQELTRITKAVQDGDFFENAMLAGAIKSAAKNGKKLHLMGLCSDGGVHSHIKHLYALLDMAKRSGLDDAYVHCFMDGRDVPPKSGKGYIEQLQGEMERLHFGKIATISGRYYAMDRDNRWERVEKAYRALVQGEGERETDAAEAIQKSYDRDVTDEFVVPVVIEKNGQPVAKIAEGDSVIFFNFRPDRAREITRTFLDTDPDRAIAFNRPQGALDLYFVSMTQYDATFGHLGVRVAFAPQSLENTLGEYLAKMGKTQFHIAETEKYAHVTFFFNGGVEKPSPGEDRFLIPSPKVATYDLQPEMSARQVADEAVKNIQSGRYDVMILNFANPDMVGHTGVLEAARDAIHTVDECVYRVVETIRACGGACMVTADHGNAEVMFDPDARVPCTAHTTNPVPFIYIDDENKSVRLREDGRLSDIAPTLLEMMNLAQPKQMTGRSMLEK